VAVAVVVVGVVVSWMTFFLFPSAWVGPSTADRGGMKPSALRKGCGGGCGGSGGAGFIMGAKGSEGMMMMMMRGVII